MSTQPDPIRHLIQLLSRLPGIGEKSATRIVFSLLANPADYAQELSTAIHELLERIQLCSVCCNLTEIDPCPICRDQERDHQIVCVVEHVPDLLAIERTQEYKGLYHVLHGALAPLDGITPEKLRVQELLARLQDNDEIEVILATNPTVEGESTALYLRKLLTPLGVTMSRIASGVPMGGDLEYIDRATLARAIQARQML